MTYEFDGFSVKTGYAGGKEFVFDSLSMKNKQGNYEIVTENMFDLIDLIEILKAFSNKKLEKEREYKFKDFKASLRQNKGVSYLFITTKFNEFYFDKFTATASSAKLQKILSRCAIWIKKEKGELEV